MQAPPLSSDLEKKIIINSNKEKKYNLLLSNKDNCLFIYAETLNNIPIIKYENNFKLENIKNNKFFKHCDSINEVLQEIIPQIKENDIKLIENDSFLILKIPLPSNIIKEASFEINKITNKPEDEFKELYNLIKNLNEKIEKINKEKDDKINLFENKLNEKDNKINLLENKIDILEKKINHLLTIKEKENKINLNIIKENKINPFINLLNNEQFELLNSWLPKKKYTTTLLYKLTRDGNKSSIFHKLCDNKGITIIFIKTSKNFLFGGYTELDWDSKNGWKDDQSTFIFSFNLKKKYLKKNSNLSIYCSLNYGPCFGYCGNLSNIQIGENLSEGTIEFGLYSSFFIKDNYDINGGENKFDVDELEIYNIKYEY